MIILLLLFDLLFVLYLFFIVLFVNDLFNELLFSFVYKLQAILLSFFTFIFILIGFTDSISGLYGDNILSFNKVELLNDIFFIFPNGIGFFASYIILF